MQNIKPEEKATEKNNDNPTTKKTIVGDDNLTPNNATDIPSVEGDSSVDGATDNTVSEAESGEKSNDETKTNDTQDTKKDNDKANEKLISAKKKLRPISKTRTNKIIKKIDGVKAKAEEKLAEGTAVGFNKQVVRMEFYRDNFRKMVNIALFNSVVMVAIIIAMLVYMFKTVPENRYFATTVDGRIMQLIPLDQPSMMRSELYAWVIQAVSDTLTFGYHDYQRRLQESTKYFTIDGWETFTTMVQNMQLLDMVGRRKLLVKAYPMSAPELQQEGVFNGRYRWVMVINFKMEMSGRGSGGGTQNLRLRLTVERVPVLENIKGIAIKRWEVLRGRY